MPPKEYKRPRTALIKLAPCLITAVVVALILRKYPLSKIALEISRGRALPMIPIALVKVVLNLLLIAAADRLVIQGASGKTLRYWDVLRAKAGSSLLDIVGYAAGHGAYGVWIARFGKLSASLAAGVMLYIMASDLIAVSAVTSISIWLEGAKTARALAIAAPIVCGVLCLFIVLGPYDIFGARKRGVRVLQPWGAIPPRVGLLQAGLRIAQINLAAIGTWIAATLFGLNIPLPVMMAYLPVVLVVQSLPINVAGFGAVQGAWLLLTPWATGEQLLAFQFLWSLMVASAIALRGLPFVRKLTEEVASPKGAQRPTGA